MSWSIRRVRPSGGDPRAVGRRTVEAICRGAGKTDANWRGRAHNTKERLSLERTSGPTRRGARSLARLTDNICLRHLRLSVFVCDEVS